MVKKKPANKFRLLIFIACAACVLLLLYILINNNQRDLPKKITATVTHQAQPFVSNTNVLATDPDTTIWWISNNDYNILIPTKDSVLFKVKPPQDMEPTTNIATILKLPNMQAFINLSIDTLKQHGFVKNEKNSSTSLADKEFYDYIQAYEKGITKCTIVVNPDLYGDVGATQFYFTIETACSNEFEKYYTEQEPILKSLDLHKEVISGIEKQQGDFYWFNINYRRSGYYTIAKKVGNTYIPIFSGQDVPPCDTMKKYAVPSSFYGQCYDAITKTHSKD